MWTEKHEHVAREWGTMAQYYSVMHNRAAKHFARRHRWLGIPCTILTALISSVDFISLTEDSCNLTWVIILSGIVCMISTGLSAAYNFLGYDERVRKHLLASSAYEGLYFDAVEQLMNEKDQRENVSYFLQSMKKTLKDIKDASPDIPEHILDRYVKDLETPIDSFAVVLKPPPEPVNMRQNTLRRKKKRVSLEKNLPLPLPEEDGWELQDAFAQEMKKRIDEKTQKMEEYYLKRDHDSP